MGGMNGIPRAFSPSQFRQEFLDFKRKVEQQLSARTYVNLANITVTEGGTIDSSVGDKLTETVKDMIVIDGGNLGEGALDGQRMVGAIIETNEAANRGVKIDDTGLRGYDADGNRYMKADESGLEMTGSISTLGKTAEATPRDIAVRMTTVSRDISGQSVANPGIIFETEGVDRNLAPGMYSPDGELLHVGSTGPSGSSLLILGPDDSYIWASKLHLGALLNTLVDIDTTTDTVSVGNAGAFGAPSKVNLVGNVKVNGNTLAGATITEFTVTGTKANVDAANQDIATPVRVAAASNGTTANPVAAGTLTIPTAGIYGIDYHLALSKAATGRTFLDIADNTNKAYTRTTIAVGEDQAASAISGRLFNAGEQIKFRVYQNTGGSANYTATIRVTKYS